MLFNRNIVLEVLRSNFAGEIAEFADGYVMSLDDFDLEDIFEGTVNFVLLDSIEEMVIEDFSVEDEENGQIVDGTCEITVSVNGFEKQGKEFIYRDTEVTVFGLGFSFYVESDKFSDIKLEYLY